MKIGDLVKIRCTCGNSHDEDPLLAVVVNTSDRGGMIQILLNGRHTWVTPEAIAGTAS